jgi:uncharacterized protein involved in outer membrane biogenesis
MKARRRVFPWRTPHLAAASLLALLLLLAAALQTPWVRSYVLGKIEAVVERETGLRLSVRSLSWNPFALRVSLHDLTLGTASGPLPPFLRAETLAVRASPALVFRKKIHFREIVLDRPVVEVAYGPDGASNLPVLPVNPAAPPLVRLPPFVLERGRIDGVRFVLDDPRSGLHLDQAGLVVHIRWTGGEIHAVELRTETAGSLRAGGSACRSTP